jgi:PAS domain S-box-containing protein
VIDENWVYQSIFESVGEGVAVLNQTLHYTHWNQAMAHIFQRPGEEVIGAQQYPWELFPDWYDQEAIQMLHQALEGETVQRENVPYQLANGEQLFFSESCFPLHNPQGQVYGVIEVLRDVTTLVQSVISRARQRHRIIMAQQQVLRELSTPIIPVWTQDKGKSIILMPLIGNIDAIRARDILRALLTGLSDHHASVVILDLTGVPTMSTEVAQGLDKAFQAAQLKGARVIITGITERVAEAMGDLGITWENIQTSSDLQTGLVIALHSIGITLKDKR